MSLPSAVGQNWAGNACQTSVEFMTERRRWGQATSPALSVNKGCCGQRAISHAAALPAPTLTVHPERLRMEETGYWPYMLSSAGKLPGEVGPAPGPWGYWAGGLT